MVPTQTAHTATSDGTTGQQSSRKTNFINVGTTERWISLIGGSALAIFAATRDIRSRRISLPGVIMTMVGGDLIFRGATGHCYVYQASGINTSEQPDTRFKKFEKVMTINRPEEDLIFFKQGSDIMASPASGQARDRANSANVPDGNLAPEQRQLQAWHTLKETVSKYSGYIQFQKAPDGRGTEVKVMIEYNPPPFGKLGAGVSMFSGKSPKQQVTEDLRHFKEMMEAGEIPTTEGQPTGPA
jgi:uncharacterized membrane protein